MVDFSGPVLSDEGCAIALVDYIVYAVEKTFRAEFNR